MTRISIGFRLVLAALLLLTAGLKLYGLSVSTVPPVGWFAQPWVQLASAEWEIVLGLWLLSGAYPLIASTAVVLTFAAFAMISGYLGWLGVASCGCFGVIHANPWWAFGLDMGVILISAIDYARQARTRPAARSEFLNLGRALSIGILGVALVFGVSIIPAFLLFGSWDAARAELADTKLVASPSQIDLGNRAPAELITTTVTIRNWTDGDVRLISGTSDCSCVATQDLPISIPRRGAADIKVHISVPKGEKGVITRAVWFGTDLPSQPYVDVVIVLTVE